MFLSKQQLKMLHDFALDEFKNKTPDTKSPETFSAECWMLALDRVVSKEGKILIIKDKEKLDE